MRPYLLVQIRGKEEVAREELQSFSRHGRVAAERFHVVNALRTELPPHEELDAYEAVFVGGASEASVLEPHRYPFIDPMGRLLRHCADSGIPVFASCFGFQVAGREFGGLLENDVEEIEMGTLDIDLCSAAEEDELFANVGSPLCAVTVHQQLMRECPPGCVELARTRRCVHAFRVAGRPFWAFQFHPELDRPTLTSRLGAYRGAYTEGAEHYERVIASLRNTEAANRLVSRFVELVESRA